ncbi:MAG: hypothetical protein IPI23_21400 [Bacteroidetes bacterium]|nr:hypothetical protein [Bacteroidota bacterium]
MNKLSKTKHSFFRKKMNWLICFLLAGFISSQSYGQISVTVTGNTNATPALAGSYSSLADAITDLNLVTSLSGPVVFELAAGT